MKIGLLAATIVLTTRLALAADPEPFAIHAVADKPGEHTREYSGPRNEPPETVLLDNTALLDHTAVLRASVEHHDGRPAILIELTPEGRKRFGEITGTYLNKRIGIVLYGKLCGAPVIKQQMLGGSLQVPGDFTDFEAIDLARKLNRSVSQ